MLVVVVVPCFVAGQTKPSAVAVWLAAAALITSVAATARRMEAARASIENIVVTDGHRRCLEMVTWSRHAPLSSGHSKMHREDTSSSSYLQQTKLELKCDSQKHIHVNTYSGSEITSGASWKDLFYNGTTALRKIRWGQVDSVGSL